MTTEVAVTAQLPPVDCPTTDGGGPGGGSASAAAAPNTGGGQPQRPVPAAQATAEQKQLQYLHHNCNPRHNNSVNAMSIETDVWQGNGEIFDFAAS